jgi:DNA-binding transcriptional regulator YiaG
MSNFSSVLKTEITRLARKEIKSAVDPLRKTNGAHRREIAELKRQLASLQRELKASRKRVPEANEGSGKARTMRFTANGMKALRARLGLSAADFGKLVGASGQSVYNWEAGKTVPRASQQTALASVRGLGKREAAKRLEAMARYR